MATAVEQCCDVAPRLDLACPIPWPRSIAQASATGSIESGSPTPKTRVATTSSPTPLGHATQSASEKSSSSARWLERRYAETLWLGEAHSPLSAFLRHLQHLESRLGSPSRSTGVLQKLLRSRQQIRERLSGSSTSADGYAARNGIVALLDDDDQNDEEEVSMEDKREHAADDIAEQKRREACTVRAALRDGPAKAVVAELRRCPPGSPLGRLGRLWIDAIETRELQLQVLVILSLLRLNAEYPSLAHEREQGSQETELDSQAVHAQSPRLSSNPSASIASSTSKPFDTAETSPLQPKKRKRKAEHSQRWTGRNGIFPWQMGRPSTSSNTFAVGRVSLFSDDQSRSDASSIEPESLSKRFESLLDVLSLRVATTNISMDLDRASDEYDHDENALAMQDASADPRTPGESPATAARRRRQAGHRVIIPPFGSEGRRRDGTKDERDVMQWFCCHVVEAHFSKSLPRQCGIIRSRCFVPSASTPAKVVSKTTKTVAAAAPATKPRSSASASSSSRLQASLLDFGSNENASKSHCQQGTDRRPSVSLERSLLKETKSRLQRTQSMAAAKLRSAYDAREVNVRKRWERSHSVGPTASAALSGSSSALDQKTARAAITLDDKDSLSDRSPSPPFLTEHAASNSQPYILVISTPSKPRPVNVLQTRKRSN